MSLRFMTTFGILSLWLCPCWAQDEKKRAGGSVNAGPGEVAVTGTLRLNDHGEMVKIYDQLLQKEPANIDYHLARGRAKLKSGDRQGGLADIQTAQQLIDINLQAQPKNASLYSQKAMGFRLLEDYPSALEHIKRAIYLDPNQETFHRDLRLIKSEMAKNSGP